ncbi:MAG: TetR family transcriptional regulator C-terminal domain-containing protein [Myxococcota bacterium]
MGRPSNRAERRREILTAFKRVVAERGYEGATIALTAEAAGILPGLVHYHFESKQELLTALFESLAETIAQRFQAAKEAQDPGPRAELDAFIDAHLLLGADPDETAVAAWVSLSAEALHNEELRARLSERLGVELSTLEDIVRRILEEEGKRRTGARAIAAAIYASIQGAFYLGVAAPKLVPRGFASPSVKRWAQRLVDPD